MQDNEEEQIPDQKSDQPIHKKPLKEEWAIRKALPDDIPFIYSTWTHSMLQGSRLGRSCKKSIFWKGQTKVIDWILTHHDTHILIAYFPEEEGVILGYVVSQHSTMHYVYVKEAFRRNGIGTDLLLCFEAHMDRYTHQTFDGKELIKNSLIPEINKMTYNPFLLFKGDSNG